MQIIHTLRNINPQVSPFNKFEVSGRIYYDQNEEKIAIKEEITTGDEKDYYQDFAFYKQVSLQT
jgi:hypothetical protein